MKISIIDFKGIRPKIAGHLLPNNAAQIAQNCKLYTGALKPWLNDSHEEELITTGTVLTAYLYNSSYWFEFAADVDIVPGPIAADTTYRRYYTGDGIPKKTNLTEATTGSGALPINFYPLGVPSPHSALTATPAGGGAGDDREISYVWTVVTSWGEESAPSPACAVVDAKNGETVNLADMTLKWQAGTDYDTEHWVEPAVLGNYVYKCVSAGTSGGAEPTFGTTVDGDTVDNGCTWRCYKKGILHDSGSAKRIYRSNTGNQYASWQLVDSIAMTATVYADTKADASLESTILPSEGWDPPPDDLTGLVSVGRFFAAWSGKSLCFSEPDYPHAWPSAYRFPLDFQPVALGTIGNSIVAATQGKPYIISGSHPDSMTPERLPEAAPCVSKRGFASFPNGVAFPTPDGLYAITADGGRLLTGGIIKKTEWAEYYPSTFNSVIHDGRYVAFFSSGGNEGGIIIDIEEGDFTTLDFYSPAVHVEELTDTLYYLKSISEVRLTEAGTVYPTRTGTRLTEAGYNRLLEA